MATWRLDLAYDGSDFHGYARQDGLRTVQGELERALDVVLGQRVETAVAGRTDAGVHAVGQVVSFTADDLEASRLIRSLNGVLGPDVSVRRVLAVDDAFHARFSARWRKYRYAIDQSEAPNPLDRHQTWHVGRELAVDEMSGALEPLLGEHDFSTFCRSVPGRTNVRRLEQADWVRGDEGLLILWIKADSFCQQMVRSIVGFCFDVGRGFSPADTAKAVLDARDRGAVATVAPPHGLTLWEVGY